MKIAIITGANRGLGRSAARQCAARGMRVLVTYNSHRLEAEAVTQEVQDAGGQAVALQLDVTKVFTFPAFARKVSEVLRVEWGRDSFDYLVNNAGYGLFEPIATVTEAQFDGLLGVHLKGPFFLTQALLPLMADGGAVVNLTSATTRVATAGVAPYAAAKGGLEVLTRYMAKEFGGRGIRANAVSPGPIRTDLGGGLTSQFEKALADQTALGRVGEPDDVGRVVASLLSEDGAWINGQSIEVAGGYVI
jgi:NAD(P)-dependent dehydrogenase (short-subunit alcohol dehydrogenase family)